MSREESDGYDYVTAKLPRTGKDGRDITSDRIGGGGRHRADGTYSGPVYDISVEDGRPVSRSEHEAALRERDELSDENDALNYENYELRMRRQEREEARRRQQFEEDWGPLIQLGVDYAFAATGAAWKAWGRPFVKRTGQKIADRFKGGLARTEEPKTERLIIDESAELDLVADRPAMSGEEAGRRLSRVALLVELLADEMRALEGVEVDGKTLDTDAVTRKLIEKSSADESLTDEEVSELEAVLLKLSEQQSRSLRHLEPPQPS